MGFSWWLIAIAMQSRFKSCLACPQRLLLPLAPLGVMPWGIPQRHHSGRGDWVVDESLLHLMHGHLTGLEA